MNELAQELRQIILTAAERLRQIPEARAEHRQGPGQWSAKEILGHLIDSAANNHSRFVRAQFRTDLSFEGYDGEQWVEAQRYQQADWLSLLQFWEAYNLHLAHVVAGIPESVLHAPRWPHTLDKIACRPVPPGEPTTLAYLIGDYLAHLREHLCQIEAAIADESQR